MDIVIVGAGLCGIVLANILSVKNKIFIIDKRSQIGGNCYDYIDKNTGIIVHKYGPHIFHIQEESILHYVKKFTKFNNYKHHVYAVYGNELFDFPINLRTINNFYNVNLRPYQVKNFLKKEAEKFSVTTPQNMEEKLINLIGYPLYNAFFLEYTMKQWGKHPKELPANIINRIPIKTNYETSYYKKPFNGIPDKGYTEMFTKMLSSKKISVELNVDFFHDKDYFFNKGTVIFTGPIDAFFDYKYGKLEYRNLRFQEECYDVEDWQGNSVINYPELKYEYTRICEPKHFYPERWHKCISNKTLIFKEIPFSNPDSEPYYPLQDTHSMAILNNYLVEAQKLDNVYFAGRLGEYKYFDMEDTIKSAFILSKRLLN